MPNKIPPQIIERYNSLSKELKDALFSDNTTDIISRLCDFYHLSDDKADILTLTIGDVLMGFVHYNDFPKVLAEKMVGNAVVAQSIAKEIDKELFLPLRKFLREVYKPISKEALLAQEVKSETEEEIPTFVPEIKPAPKPIDLVKPKEESAAPQEEASKRKPFFPFFKFKKPETTAAGSIIGAPVIVGKQAEVKPTLEAPTPFVISFEEVSPQKEKVISSVEVAMDKKPSAIKSETVPKTTATELKSTPQPVKIVNFPFASNAAPTPAKEATPVAATPLAGKNTPPPEVKKETPPIIQFSPFPANKMNTQAAAISDKPLPAPTPVSSERPTAPVSQPEKQPINNSSFLASAPIIKEEKPIVPAPSEKMPEVPPENVVDLRKFKF